MANNGLRGQATVEFLLTLVIVLIFIVTIINPNADLASKSVQDTTNLAKLRVSIEKLSGAIKYASVSGSGTKETLLLIIPQDGNIICTPNQAVAPFNTDLNLVYLLKSGEGITSCEIDDDNPANSTRCTRTIRIGTSFKCNNPPVPAGIYRATVTKTADTPNVQINFELVR